MKSELQSAIENLISVAKAEAVREFVAAGMATSAGVVKTKPGRKPRAAKRTAPKSKPARVAKAKTEAAPKAPRATGQKRSEEEMAGLIGELRAHVEHNPGQSIEAIGKALAKPTKLLALPMKKLIKSGVVRVEGERRATRYFQVGHAESVPEPKRANGAAKRVTTPIEAEGPSAEA